MFKFNFGEVDLVSLDVPGDSSEPSSPPEDLYDVIETGGDRYRDWFTRMCLYAVGRSFDAAQDAANQVIVVGTEYGNTPALLGLQRAAESQGRRMSSQYFPSATSSSAAAFLSMRIGATGGNYTINAGLLTPIMAFWQALCGLGYPESSGSRLLVGDIYCPESRADAGKETPDLACEPGLVHTCLTAGSEFEAGFEFNAPDEADEIGEPPISRIYLRGPIGATCARYGRNSAFALADLLRASRRMEIGESVSMECLSFRGPRGKVTITRLSEQGANMGRSGR
ncbi:hypothetical protein OG241_48490 [Streptomyces sp. NBC_01390]|uniref:hypothetical protein n=1 Tax=Streptomyces sp. NBC_01390 TaxID=2903850 RepID=UPI003243073E